MRARARAHLFYFFKENKDEQAFPTSLLLFRSVENNFPIPATVESQFEGTRLIGENRENN